MHRHTPDDKSTVSVRRRLKEVAAIRSKLILKALTLTKIDAEYELPAGTASNTLREPHTAGERAIAAALGTHPHLLWPSRYHGDGRRKRPQPIEAYRIGRRAQEAEAA